MKSKKNTYLSKRYEWIIQSEIRNMTIECDLREGINLSQGVCDTEVPQIIKNGAKEAIDHGFNYYTRYDGLDELRCAIAHKQRKFFNMEVDPKNEIVVSAGSTGALFCACFALLNPGDEVVLFEPYYGYHLNTLRLIEAIPKFVSTYPPDWTIDFGELKKSISPKTRAIIINSPSNPSGKVFSLDELKKISNLAAEKDLIIFTDEIYEHFVYDGRKHIPMATLPEMKERTVTISGLSKTFCITGWRIGYTICKKEWSEVIGYFNDLIYVCAPAPLQWGAVKGLLEISPEYYEKIAKDFQKKRDKLCGVLENIGFSPYIPQGAYYVLADISILPGKSSKEKVMYLLEKTGVACVPGEAFYHDDYGQNLARFCFAKEDTVLDEACERLKRSKI